VFVLLYIQSCVRGSIEYSGTQFGDYYLIPWRLTTLTRRKILDSAVNEVSEALSMHVAPLAIWIVVVPAGETVLLGLCNPPRSWTCTMGPSLPGLTIDPCGYSLLCYRLIRQPKSIHQDSPKIWALLAPLLGLHGRVEPARWRWGKLGGPLQWSSLWKLCYA
jgi:hypothetical protein